jgi:CDGSH-type Zn-finger protein
MVSGGTMAKKEKMRAEPYVLVMNPGIYHWCSCGGTKTPPFCDMSRQGTGCEPVKTVIEKEGPVVWCGCGETQDPPFCDGNHKVPIKKIAIKSIMRKEPYVLVMKPGTYYWCSCGGTKTPPFCDGTHKGTKKTPVKFVIKIEHPVVLCGCRGTKDPPLCDGTHSAKKK